MRISRMLNAYTYPGCTQDVTRRHPSTARDLRRRDMAILELKNIVTSGTVGNRLGFYGTEHCCNPSSLFAGVVFLTDGARDLFCSAPSCSSAHTMLIPLLCSIREQRAQNNKSLFNGNKFRDFCGNKLKSYVGKVFGSIRSTNHAVMGNEERLHVTWKEGHCQKLA
ncbi:hypothetical protein Ahy_A02g009140 isoform B [Arachis hypogaea]|uniref:Uncharacterized protein n=1 Tax=Arachis hypogaea TaxID=3818 RepID=A0A445EGB8_ARAHY|nr:hypothetical protein Ahy_A02g009140 isoform B [Arachis hypogaea]